MDVPNHRQPTGRMAPDGRARWDITGGAAAVMVQASATARPGYASTDRLEDVRVCLMLPWRVTAILDADRALVASSDQTLEVNRAFEPDLAVGDDVLVSCGIVVRRLMPDEADEIRDIFASAPQEAQPPADLVR